MHWLIMVFAVAIGIARFYMPHNPLSLPGSYQAVAHLFVGFLFTGFLASFDAFADWASKNRWTLLLYFAGLTALETIAFFTVR